ncbi:MAG: dihydrodipicolinate synthase family protein [Rhodospirillaceae bacterium]
MVRYKKNEAREWARENMHGLANVVLPSYTTDLKRLNEKGIRHDIRRDIELGFWGTLLVSEMAITLEEYRDFIRWSHEEAAGRLTLIHHALFNTLEENIEAVQMAEKEGCELVLLGYPSNFYATTSQEIYDYTRKFCEATRLGVIIFPVPHWGFERIHPAGMDPELVKQMVADIPNIVCIKAESGMPAPGGFVQAWKNHSHEVVVTCPIEADALPFAALVPIQFMGTSNYEFYGDMIPKMFKLVRDGRFDEMMKLYWQIHPARTVYRSVAMTYQGAGVLHRMVWKYQAWLQGFNGGPLRQPTMKIRDVHMRQLREALKRSGLKPTEDPDKEFFVGRNPA